MASGNDITAIKDAASEILSNAVPGIVSFADLVSDVVPTLISTTVAFSFDSATEATVTFSSDAVVEIGKTARTNDISVAVSAVDALALPENIRQHVVCFHNEI